MWSRPPRCWPRRAASSFDEIARQTTENFFRLFAKVPRPAARRMPEPHDAELHHPRLRLVRRRAAAGAGLGRLRSEQSEEPPAAHLAAGRAARRAAASRASWSTPRPTCASSCSTPRSIGSTACSSPTSTPTTPTASTICARSSSSSRRRVDVYLDEPTVAGRCAPASAIASRRRPAATIRRSSPSTG